MPIAASFPALQSQLVSAFSNGPGANPTSVATQIASAVGSIVPTGIFPPFPPTPLVPAGLSAGISLMQQAFSLQQGANKKTVSQMMAQAISLIAPTAPPAGLSILQQQIESAMALEQGAQQNLVATIIASAIISYYTMGGVL